MKAPRRSREDWIAAGMEVLGDVGVDKLRVERIAAMLGVTKGSFYWHFKDRSQLLEAIVETWETLGTEYLAARAEPERLDPDARSQHLLKMISASGDSHAENAIRDWARRNDAIAERVQRVDDRRMRYLEAVFKDLGLPEEQVGPRSLLAYSLLIGDFLVTTSHARRAQRRRTVADALKLLVKPD